MTGRNATTGVPTITTSGNWANLGFVAPHEFDTSTTNGLTVFNLAGVQGMPPRADRNRMAALFQSNNELFVHTATPDNYYNAFIVPKRDYLQTVTSGYTQADVRVSAALQVRAGVRWERTQNAVTEWDPQFRGEVVGAGFPVNANGLATTFAGLRYQYQSLPRATRRAEYDSFFPSISAKYYLMRDLELQAGYSKAISRPPIDNLAGLWSVAEKCQRRHPARQCAEPGAAAGEREEIRRVARLLFRFPRHAFAGTGFAGRVAVRHRQPARNARLHGGGIRRG